MEVPITAVRQLLDYLGDERKHYECSPDDGHIYHSIKTVERWARSFPTSD